MITIKSFNEKGLEIVLCDSGKKGYKLIKLYKDEVIKEWSFGNDLGLAMDSFTQVVEDHQSLN